MPKLGSIVDQSRLKFSDLVNKANDKDQDQLPTLQGIVTLGKEWRYYKKEIDNEKRKIKKQAEREAERGSSMGGGFRGGGGGGDFRGGGGRGDFRGGYSSYRGNSDRGDRGGYLGKRDSKRW
jgi:hypothetical protein